MCIKLKIIFIIILEILEIGNLYLSSEIGLFEVENMVRNWIFARNLVQYWFPFVKHGVFCRNFSVLNHVPDFKRSYLRT